jgi:hypothetical protein
LTTVEFITQLFCRIDDQMKAVPKDPRANLHPSELITLAVLYALKGKGQRAFYRWLVRDHLPLFPRLPERTRFFGLIAVHREWADRFLAEPTLPGISDSLGVEMIHPRREGRSPKQIGRKGNTQRVPDGRWIVGVKFCPVINSRGQIVDWDIVDWDAEGANVHDSLFQDRMLTLYESGERGMGLYVDSGFHKSPGRGGDRANLKVCQRGGCNLRMLVETLFSQLTGVMGLKKIGERAWASVEARLGFVAAAYNLLISWGGRLVTDESGYVRLGIAEFAL